MSKAIIKIGIKTGVKIAGDMIIEKSLEEIIEINIEKKIK